MSANQQNRDEILYIYDRVCTREAKQREVLRKYGMVDALTDNPSRDRVYVSPYARPAKKGASPTRTRRNTERQNDRTTGRRRAYASRPA